jgi:hypothetical protein
MFDSFTGSAPERGIEMMWPVRETPVGKTWHADEMWPATGQADLTADAAMTWSLVGVSWRNG